MDVSLNEFHLTSGGYTALAQVSSVGISGYGSSSDATIVGPAIDNTANGYLVYAWSTAWDSNLVIIGALVTYTIAEAP